MQPKPSWGLIVDQTADPNPNLASRVAQSREQGRRIRIVQRIAALGAMGLLICFLAVLLRNRAHLRQGKTRFEKSIVTLRANFADTASLPMSYPPPDASGLPQTAEGLTYQDVSVIRHLRESQEGGVVTYSDNIRQILRPDARIVLMLNSGQLSIETMSASQFRQHQEALRQRVAATATGPPQGSASPPTP